MAKPLLPAAEQRDSLSAEAGEGRVRTNENIVQSSTGAESAGMSAVFASPAQRLNPHFQALPPSPNGLAHAI